MLSALAHWRSYLELCKLRVVALMLLTALVGMFLATPGWVPWHVLLLGTLGIGLSAASAAAINHILDRRIDALMGRTQYRPLPTGRVSSKQACYFAAALGIAGMVVLTIWINPLTALLTFLTLVGYAGLYTVYLKRATSQNIVIGGLAGAAPPLLGWTAVTGYIDPHSLLLVLIIFVWTPPHFWALAIHRHAEYAKAEIPMLPVTHGIPHTKLNILLYTILLFIVSLFPTIMGMSGLYYLIGAVILGLGFIYWAVILKYTHRPHAAIRTFQYSIVYLMALFVVLLVDHHWKILT